MRTKYFGALVLCFVLSCSAQQSRWVFPGDDGRLHYAQGPKKDRIPDFSFAGYRGGGIALPHVAAVRQIAPGGGDDTASIQAAIDQVSQLPLQDGFRGAVELKAGTFHCANTLTIRQSGVVLRGAGREGKGTVIDMTGSPHRALDIAGQYEEKKLPVQTVIADRYVPFGVTTVNVKDASAFHAGDVVRITKPVTTTWTKTLGMDNLQRVGREEHWVGDELSAHRSIRAVHGNAITFDIALMDNYDAYFTGVDAVTVTRVEIAGRIANVGVEHLAIRAQARSIDRHDPHYDGVTISDAVDTWLDDVELEDTTEGVRIEINAERLTLRRVDVNQRMAVTSSAKNFQFSINGTQVLLDRCSGHGNSVFFIGTQPRQQGPVVALHCHFDGNGKIEPHQRWFTGLLIDNCEVPGGGINMINRGIMGSGHGWAIAWAIIWNSSAKYFTLQQAPFTLSWSIGNQGEQRLAAMPDGKGHSGPILPAALVESQGHPVKPGSLYLHQLADRLGVEAVLNLGYTKDDLN